MNKYIVLNSRYSLKEALGENQMSEEIKTLTLNKETVDVLVANVIPTTKYFEFRFDNMQRQINHIEKQNDKLRFDMDKRFDGMQQDMDKRFDGMQQDMDKRFDGMQQDMDRRFERVDKRFEQVDKRFEQVDKRFEQVDKRFEQMIFSIDKLTDVLENRDIEQRSFTIKMFMISISISVLGVLGVVLKVAGVFN